MARDINDMQGEDDRSCALPDWTIGGDFHCGNIADAWVGIGPFDAPTAQVAPSGGPEDRSRTHPALRDPRERSAAQPRRKPETVAARFTPGWDTLDDGLLVDFLFSSPPRDTPQRPVLWLFVTENVEVPMLRDLWLHNGTAEVLRDINVSYHSAEVGSAGEPALRYRNCQPNEAVRLETVDETLDARVPPALWLEVTAHRGWSRRFGAGPQRWKALPHILLRAR